jgi:hypothetical protein
MYFLYAPINTGDMAFVDEATERRAFRCVPPETAIGVPIIAFQILRYSVVF